MKKNILILVTVILLTSLTSIGFAAKSKTKKLELLDRIDSVIDNKILTLSVIKRVQGTIAARRKIAPLIYIKDKLSNIEVTELFIQQILIRDRLAEMGFIVGDDQVEADIKLTEKQLGLNRKALLSFLKQNNITYDEYFEIVRETREIRWFNYKIIKPLISISEQEIKNFYYKQNLNNKTLAFKYTLVDFYIEKNKLTKAQKNNYKNILKKFQSTGILPEAYSTVNTNVLGDITEDGLTANLKTLLKKTDEGSFSNTIVLNNEYHIFFMKKKDLVESSIFLKQKDQIKDQLYTKHSKNMTDLWYNREKNKHYIKYFN